MVGCGHGLGGCRFKTEPRPSSQPKKSIFACFDKAFASEIKKTPARQVAQLDAALSSLPLPPELSVGVVPLFPWVCVPRPVGAAMQRVSVRMRAFFIHLSIFLSATGHRFPSATLYHGAPIYRYLWIIMDVHKYS